MDKKHRNQVGVAALVGLSVGLAVFLLFSFGTFEGLELRTLDARFRQFSGRRSPSREIVIVTIDQNSIDYLKNRLGILWKWPRDVYARTIDYLSESGARAILLDLDYSDPDINRAEFEEGETDRLLGESIGRAGDVVVSTLFYRKALQGQYFIDDLDRQTLRRHSLQVPGLTASALKENQSVVAPITGIMAPSRRVGASNVYTDDDGVIRRLPLFQKYEGSVYPATALALYLTAANITEVAVDARGRLALAQRVLPLGASAEIYLNWYGPGGPAGATYRYYPIADVLLSRLKQQQGLAPLIPPEEFRNKIVLIGSNAPSLYDLKPTPFTSQGEYPGVEIVATAVNNLLDSSVLAREGKLRAGAVIFLCAGASAVIVLLFKSVAWNAILSLVLVLLIWAYNVWCFQRNVFSNLVPAEVAVALSFTVMTAVNYLTEGREKRWLKKAFSQYSSAALIDDLIRHPESLKLGGERRELSVLFSDIRGFTSISEKLDPERLSLLLNEYLSPMTEIVFSHKGMLDKYIGDAVMALFGAPLKLDNHPELACRAALEMIRELARLRAGWRERGQPDFIQNMKIGIGINSGPVSLGNMGSHSRFDYTVIGDNVNLASRLEGTTKLYGVAIVVSENTRDRVRDLFAFRELDLIRVVGKNTPIRIFELLGAAGEADTSLLERARRFEEGVALYRAGRWEESLKVFEELLESDRGDAAARLYTERCRGYLADPPPAGWDGVYDRREK